MVNLKNKPQMILLHPHMILIRITMKKNMNHMIKFNRIAMIKGEMTMKGIEELMMMGIREMHHHIQERVTMIKEITLSTTYLVISKRVTIRSCVVNFCEHYSFVSSFEPFKIEDALRDTDWVVVMQEELNNFKRNEVLSLVERRKQNGVGTK
jgi:hypothetical protein